jgi:VWFA-related protein
VAETGAAGANRLALYSRIGPFLDNVVGAVPHRVAVVGFDSAPSLALDFTEDLEQVRGVMNNLRPGDDGDAIFDSLGYAVELLRKQPANYRRAILLMSETLDHGSQMKLADILRALGDTNTAIYTMGFSSTRAEMKHEGHEFNATDEPGPAGGCMSRDTKPTTDDDDQDADNPDDAKPARSKQQSRVAQAYDCASLLAPPLRAAKMLAMLAMNGLHKNAPETVAQLTGGEYYKFGNEKTFERELMTIANHIPNRYVLSFTPQSPHPGLHAIKLEVKDYAKLHVTARTSYWVDDETRP